MIALIDPQPTSFLALGALWLCMAASLVSLAYAARVKRFVPGVV